MPDNNASTFTKADNFKTRVAYVRTRLAQTIVSTKDLGFLSTELEYHYENELEVLKEVLNTPDSSGQTLLEYVADKINEFKKNDSQNVFIGDKSSCQFSGYEGTLKAAKCLMEYGANPDSIPDSVKDALGSLFFNYEGANIKNPICDTSCNSTSINPTLSTLYTDHPSATSISTQLPIIKTTGFIWDISKSFISLARAGAYGSLDGVRYVVLHIAKRKGCSDKACDSIDLAFAIGETLGLMAEPFVTALITKLMDDLDNDQNDPLINSERVIASVSAWATGFVLYAGRSIIERANERNLTRKNSITRFALNSLPFIAMFWIMYSSEKNLEDYVNTVISVLFAALVSFAIQTGYNKMSKKPNREPGIELESLNHQKNTEANNLDQNHSPPAETALLMEEEECLMSPPQMTAQRGKILRPGQSSLLLDGNNSQYATVSTRNKDSDYDSLPSPRPVTFLAPTAEEEIINALANGVMETTKLANFFKLKNTAGSSQQDTVNQAEAEVLTQQLTQVVEGKIHPAKR